MRILIISFFIYTQVLGQVNGNSTQLFSRGATPSFLEKYKSRFYIPQSDIWIKGIKKDNKKFYLDQIYASNMIVYGDPISLYCTDLLKELTSNHYSVFLVRSDAVATFSDSSNIFITSGLISRLSNEAQLMFFLSREVEIIKGDYNPEFEKAKSKISLNNAITELSTYSNEVDFELDKKTVDLIKSKNLYTEKEIISAFYVLKFQNRPFYESSFDIEYFNNKYSYIPESKFFLIHKPNPEYYKYESEFPQLLKRSNKFKRSPESTSSFTFLKNRKDFENIVNIARHESVAISVLKADFTEAIYEIYTLEKLGHTSAFLGNLKASAWWGFVNQYAGEIKLKNYSLYEISDSKGAVFMRFLRMQTTPAKITLALRTLKDLKDLYPESKSISRMFDDLVSIAANSVEFKLESYYKTGLISAIRQFHSNDSIQKSDNNLLDPESQITNAKGVDSVNYHYFMIPDLVKNKSFIDKYNFYKTAEIENTTKSNNSLSIGQFSLVKYKKGKIKKLNNQNEILEGAYSIANKETRLKVSAFNSEDQYNLKYLINSVYFQNYYYNNYKKLVHSPFSDKISSLLSSSGTDAVAFCLFEQAYEPGYRPFHLLGLLGITLPYIVPEFFLSGNKCIYSSLYFNVSNGTTEGLVYNRFNDPFNKHIIQDAFLKSILITFQKDD